MRDLKELLETIEDILKRETYDVILGPKQSYFAYCHVRHMLLDYFLPEEKQKRIAANAYGLTQEGNYNVTK